MTKLTQKQERFCLAIVAGKKLSDAYRQAFKPKNCKAKTIHEQASKLRAKPKIDTRIAELMKPAIQSVQITREEWLKKMESFFHADVRKMFVGPGQPIEISELNDHEAAIVEGFEVVENFEKVGDKAEHVGYTKKVKLTPKLKAMIEFGKVMGFYTEKRELTVDMTLEELVLGSFEVEDKKA